jgi:hypothetical protein
MIRKILLAAVFGIGAAGWLSPSAWAHAGHHGDAGAIEDEVSQPMTNPQNSFDGAYPDEQVVTRALDIPGFIGSTSGAELEDLTLSEPVLNLIGEGALLLVLGSPFLLFAVRRSWS